MIRIRFHGRGGHGVKTASRIAGAAAFLSGYQVQDCPVFGAERRGAAVTAFTRIDREPILERGAIEQPDLIVLADDTLLADPAAGVLAGQHSAAALFVNSESEAGLAERFAIVPPVITYDISRRTRELLGRASALSAGLGAAAVRLAGGIPLEQLVRGARDELEQLHLTPQLVDRNVDVAAEVYQALSDEVLSAARPDPESRRSEDMNEASEICPVRDEGAVRGAPSILATGNASQRHTGAWRVERPEIDYDCCTRCGLCFVACPDGAIALDEHGYPVIDYDHCKGCMICRQVCPLEAIGHAPEVRAW